MHTMNNSEIITYEALQSKFAKGIVLWFQYLNYSFVIKTAVYNHINQIIVIRKYSI